MEEFKPMTSHIMILRHEELGFIFQCKSDTEVCVFFFFPWQILQILVRAVVGNMTDSQGEQAGSLLPKLKELLGRVSSRHSSDSEIWRQYALLYSDGRSSNTDDNEKVSAITSIIVEAIQSHYVVTDCQEASYCVFLQLHMMGKSQMS